MESGELVAANVRLERLLSEGGMGSVWVAEHLTLNTKVAVKFMSAELAVHPEALSRFKREASAAARVKSPHIVQVFDYGLTRENIPYIVMELLQGEDLEARVERAPLTLGDTLAVIQQVCKALGRAHQQGIIHRDIKPPNIFLQDVDGDVFVKVLDFGIAKQTTVDESRVTHVTRAGAMLGTPHYMSPEQIMSSADIDLRSDLWAVGVVAYRCITGAKPFDGETFGALAVAINAAEYIPASSRVPGLPPAIDAWFTRALARLPENRFASAKEMADSLTEAVPREQRSRRPPPLDSSSAVITGQVPIVEPRGNALSTADTQYEGPKNEAPVGRVRRWPMVLAAVAVAGVVGGVGAAVYVPKEKISHAATIQSLATPTSSSTPASTPITSAPSATASAVGAPSAPSTPSAIAAASTSGTGANGIASAHASPQSPPSVIQSSRKPVPLVQNAANAPSAVTKQSAPVSAPASTSKDRGF